MTTVVVTGAGAGVGRAIAEAFAARGCDLALLARSAARLEAAAAAVGELGGRALVLPTDVADADAVEAAAERAEQELGPIDIWVNDAMATIFAPLHAIAAAEFQRATEVTYLGTVYGTMAALRRMRPRDRGTIVNVGSALSYRAIPLQSAYCGAKFAIRGFTDSLRCELLHERSRIHLTMVHLPAMNTPQFDWARNHTGHLPQPVPPVFQPEVAARAVVFAACKRRREMWVGWPTVKAILANKLAPGLLDRYLARYGYTSQLATQRLPGDFAGNLFAPGEGHAGAHGRFDAIARSGDWEVWSSRHRDALALGALALGGVGAWSVLRRLVGRGRAAAPSGARSPRHGPRIGRLPSPR
jgi:NAD(P)-dependent dehydrogenase (short-subunit alcohol dehydrogenase family)